MTTRCDHRRAVGFCAACQEDWAAREPYEWVDPEERRGSVELRVEKIKQDYALEQKDLERQQSMIDRAVNSALRRYAFSQVWNRP